MKKDGVEIFQTQTGSSLVIDLKKLGTCLMEILQFYYETKNLYKIL